MREGKYFKQQIDQLTTEIEFALRWQGPIILLVIYRSSHVLDDAEASLSAELTLLKQELVSVRVRSDSSNIVETIAGIENRENKVFSIADLDQGGGTGQADAYRTLNLHREYFIEKNIRCVLWLTNEEARQLSLVAPDFWAFRHRVIDFLGERATPLRSASFQGLVWIEWPWHLFEDDSGAAITYREQLLGELPDEPETMLMRINLYAEIAGLYLLDENWAQALEIIKQGLDGVFVMMIPELEARLLVGLAIIYIQLEEYTQAQAALQKAGFLNSENGDYLTLLAQVSRLEGRRSEALAYVQKAIRLRPEHAFVWNECGNIYADLGRNKKAIDAYQKAFDLSPKDVLSLVNKSAILASENRLDEALKLLDTIQREQRIVLRKVYKMRGFEFLVKIK